MKKDEIIERLKLAPGRAKTMAVKYPVLGFIACQLVH